jgi:hypothetical protein
MKAVINEHIMRNLIYCEETHSFTHRLFDKIVKEIRNADASGKAVGYRDAQEWAWRIVADMNEEREDYWEQTKEV